MNIAKALKVKNRLIGELKSLRERFASVNAYIDNDGSTVDRGAIFKSIGQTQERLIALKSALAYASANIAHKLVEIAETKSELEFFKNLYILEGFTSSYEFDADGKQIIKQIPRKNHVDENTRQDIMKSLSDKIANLQDEIDDYNAMTIIDWKD